MEKTTTKVSQELCKGRCSITYGAVQDFANDVTIQSVRRTQMNVRTGAEVAGSGQNVQPVNLNRNMQAELRRFLRRFLHANEDCQPGCYCDSFGQITTRLETINLTLTMQRDEERTWGWIDSSDVPVPEIVDKVKSGQLTALDASTGRPLVFNPDLDEVGTTHITCCGGFRKTLEIQIMNRFKYEIAIRAKLTLSTEQGECRTLDISGGTVV